MISHSKKTLIISGRLDGLNDYTEACRKNPHVGARMKKENQQLISWYIRAQLHGVHFDGPVRLDFRWFEPNKRRDLDNIAFAKKFVQDALVNEKVISSDGWKGVAGLSDNFFVDKDNPRIEVDITEIKEV